MEQKGYEDQSFITSEDRRYRHQGKHVYNLRNQTQGCPPFCEFKIFRFYIYLGDPDKSHDNKTQGDDLHINHNY